jgi:hypothetical protein
MVNPTTIVFIHITLLFAVLTFCRDRLPVGRECMNSCLYFEESSDIVYLSRRPGLSHSNDCSQATNNDTVENIRSISDPTWK